MYDNITFNLQALIESIEKIELYSKDFDDADKFYHDQKSFYASMMQFVVCSNRRNYFSTRRKI